MRVRAGPKKQPHFFHLTSNSACHLENKSLEHIQTQLYIQSVLPHVKLEREFPEIGRIADVVWEDARIVFEVQRSPISVTEVKERIENYMQAGFFTVWILHERNFNQTTLSEAEEYLCTKWLTYFTNINGEGEGIIYDQAETIEKGRRKWKSSPFQLNLNFPKQLDIQSDLLLEARVSNIPQIKNRINKPFLIEGDFLDQFTQDPLRFQALQNEKIKEIKKERGRYPRLISAGLEWLLRFT